MAIIFRAVLLVFIGICIGSSLGHFQQAITASRLIRVLFLIKKFICKIFFKNQSNYKLNISIKTMKISIFGFVKKLRIRV